MSAAVRNKQLHDLHLLRAKTSHLHPTLATSPHAAAIASAQLTVPLLSFPPVRSSHRASVCVVNSMAVKIVKHTLEIIHLVTGQNPVQVLTDAVMKSGPREDSTRIGSAGVVRRQAVDVSPLRRVNQAIYLITTGARNASFRNIKSIAECLADEIINAANDNQNSFAIKKKDEIERVAKANR